MDKRNKIFTNIDFSKFDLTQISDLENKKHLISEWISGIKNGNIINTKEEALQSDFLNLFFGKVLDYDYSKSINVWNLEKELKTTFDGTKPDGALGFFKKDLIDVRVVIELKDGKTNLDTPQKRNNSNNSPVEQAFTYAPKNGNNCKWIIVSNLVEIRLYNSADINKFELFLITELLNDEQLKRFFALLHRNCLISNLGPSDVDIQYEKIINPQYQYENKYEKRYTFYLSLNNPQKQYSIENNIELIENNSINKFLFSNKVALPTAIKQLKIKNFDKINNIEIIDIPVDVRFIYIIGSYQLNILQSISIGLFGNIDGKTLLLNTDEIISLELLYKGNNVINNSHSKSLRQIDNFIAFGTNFFDEKVDILNRPLYSLFNNDGFSSFENSFVTFFYSKNEIFNFFKSIILSFFDNFNEIKIDNNKLLFVTSIYNSHFF